MRLAILDSGHGFGTKMLFALIRTMSGRPVLDVVKLVRYRPDYYGRPMQRATQEVMRGASSWSVADREFMAAAVAKAIRCEFCIQAHTAVAQRAYGNQWPVAEWLDDLDAAQIEEPLKATVRMLMTMTREQTIGTEDVERVLAAGASVEQIEDALKVGYVFNIITRLADAFGFDVPDSAAFEAGAKYLLARGYR